MIPVTKKYQSILEAARQLPREERLTLAHRLLGSVVDDEFPPGPLVTKEEILQEAEEALTGKGRSVDGFKFLDELDRKYARARAKAA